MRRWPPLALALLVAVSIAGDAWALTAPMPGGVAFPTTGEALRLPFPAGSAVRISAAYGPSAGSSLHTNLAVSDRGNDYYALDLVYDGYADGGRGMPIVAALSGTVVRAGWATAGWANFGQRVILRHDLGDGRVYHSLYAHLHAIDPSVTEGAVVRQGQALGALGGSCMGALSCSSFSLPHLHFSVHRDSMIGGSGTGGSYGGNAVVPEPIDGYEDLARGQVLTSMNTGGPPVCGDGHCTGGETHASCAEDCPICEPVPPAGRVIDETDLCFRRGGDPAYWRTEPAGWLASLIWTHTTDSATADNHGIWDLTFEEGGRYLVEAYTDAGFAQAQRAAYQIRHGGGLEVVTLDQSAADGWRSLGEHTFAAGGEQSVRVDDNTGEPFALRRQIVFDAIRLTRADTPALDAGSAEDAGALADAASAGDAGAPPSDGAVARGADAASARDGGDGALTGDGCACRAGPERGPGPPVLPLAIALGLLVLATRRR